MELKEEAYAYGIQRQATVRQTIDETGAAHALSDEADLLTLFLRAQLTQACHNVACTSQPHLAAFHHGL